MPAKKLAGAHLPINGNEPNALGKRVPSQKNSASTRIDVSEKPKIFIAKSSLTLATKATKPRR